MGVQTGVVVVTLTAATPTDIRFVWVDDGACPPPPPPPPPPQADGDVRRFGAAFDGASHPLGESFPTLAAAQAVYPHATSLADEIDWAACQAAVDAAAGPAVVQAPMGEGVFNRPLLIGDRPVLFQGRGPEVTRLRQTAGYEGPFVLVYAAATYPRYRTTSAGTPGGQVALRFTNWAAGDGCFILSDHRAVDALRAAAGVTAEAWVRRDALAEGRYDAVFGSCGAIKSDSTDAAAALQLHLTLRGGVQSAVAYCQRNGSNYYGTYCPLPGGYGDWVHCAVQRYGATMELWLNGAMVASDAVPAWDGTRWWEDFFLGVPCYFWPEGHAVQGTVDGAVCGFRLSAGRRYAAPFTPDPTPPAFDAAALVVPDPPTAVADILLPARCRADGVEFATHFVYKGQGNVGYARGGCARGLTFVGGTIGLWLHDVPNVQVRDLNARNGCRYPVVLARDSFATSVYNCNLQGGRYGIALLNNSGFGSVRDCHLDYQEIALVSADSHKTFSGIWANNCAVGYLLLRGDLYAPHVENCHFGAEGGANAEEFAVRAVGLTALTVVNGSAGVTSGAPAVILDGVRAAAFTGFATLCGPAAACAYRFDRPPGRKAVLAQCWQETRYGGAEVPLTNRPEFVEVYGAPAA